MRPTRWMYCVVVALIFYVCAIPHSSAQTTESTGEQATTVQTGIESGEAIESSGIEPGVTTGEATLITAERGENANQASAMAEENHTNLMYDCITAFLAVFVLLTLLAIVMWIITAVYPGKPEDLVAAGVQVQAAGAGMATVAVITTSLKAAYPSARIQRIEEIRP